MQKAPKHIQSQCLAPPFMHLTPDIHCAGARLGGRGPYVMCHLAVLGSWTAMVPAALASLTGWSLGSIPMLWCRLRAAHVHSAMFAANMCLDMLQAGQLLPRGFNARL